MSKPADRTARPGGYSTGRTTKSTIVARAAEAFAEEGFHGASMRSIARAAEVDHSTLLHHFGSKTGLLLAVLEWHDEQHIPATMPTHVTAELVADGLIAVAERNRNAPGLVRLLTMLTAEAASEAHPARPALQARHRILRRIIAATIQSQREAGAVGDDGLAPDQAAALVVSTWEGLQAYDALHPGEIDVPTLLAHVVRQAFGLAPR